MARLSNKPLLRHLDKQPILRATCRSGCARVLTLTGNALQRKYTTYWMRVVTRLMSAGESVAQRDCAISPPMLVQARQKDAADHYLAGDIESSPLATATFDLVMSNLSRQRCAIYPRYSASCIGWCARGVVAFTTLVRRIVT